MNLTIFKQLFNKLRLFFIFLIVSLIVIYSSLSYSQNTRETAQGDRLSPQFESLQKTLTDYGFIVKLEIPPHQNRYGMTPYGLLEGKTKTVWINPVVFELGNAEPTLIHEAIHAAQLCAGNGEFALLNLGIDPPKMTHPYFMRYHNYRREIETEAYTVQVQPNRLELANELLNSHCTSNNNR